MRRRHLLATRCDRARALGSARLDGPLSELERTDLERHLGECAECRHAVAEMTRLTGRVRAEPLGRAPRWEGLPGAAPRPARRRRLGVFAGVATAAAAAAALGALAASQTQHQPPAQQRPTTLVVAQNTTHFPWPQVTGVSGPQLRSGKH